MIRVGCPGAERHHAPAPALRHRQRKQVAQQVEDVLDVIVEADALGRIGADAGAVVLGEPDRTADAGVEAGVFRQRRADHALAQHRLDQHQRLAVRGLPLADRADIERGVRPGGLGQVLDDAGNVIVAFDQQHIARPERGAQRIRIARRERLVALFRALQIVGNSLPDATEHPVHDTRVLGRAVVSMLRLVARKLAETHCNSVHCMRNRGNEA